MNTNKFGSQFFIPTPSSLAANKCPAVWLTLALSLSMVMFEAMAVAGEQRVYIGTYTRGESDGIYAFRMDDETGALTAEGLVAKTENPSFLAIHPGGKFLYAVNEIGKFQGKSSGAVTAFSIDSDTGKLVELNQQPSGGGAPCHIVVDGTGKHALVANYTGGNVASLPIRKSGKLGPATSLIQHKGSSVNPKRQQGPHAHSINVDSQNKFAVAADLGLDKVLVYRFDANSGKLTPHKPTHTKVAPGAGPRHFAFHPEQSLAFVINELDSTVTVLNYDSSKGQFTAEQTVSTLPKGETGGNSTAEVQVHPNGRFVYGSNRGHDSIAVFSLDPKSRQLTLVENESTRGKTPRNFGIDPSGKFLIAANQSTNNLVVFAIDQQTGKLSPTGHEVKVASPVCVKFFPLD